MLNRIFIFFLNFFINIIDLKGKKKIINFFKKTLNEKYLTVIDVGAHKGETIDLFMKNFNVSKIYAFEANPLMFDKIKKKVDHKNYKNKIIIFNTGLGEKEEIKNLNIFNDTSSSTFKSINKNNNYFKRKKFILSLFNLTNIFFHREVSCEIKPLEKFNFMKQEKNIDILKIDTEGYEYNVLKGIKLEQFKKIRYIYFEHHYDLMINKNYKFTDINQFLKKNNFLMLFKNKMSLRKTFEYIYENKYQ
jgi:FkbM family methyltransferase